MSKKKSRRAPSPMEQGELDDESPVDLTSPELRLEADDSHFSPDEDEEERRTSEEEEEHRKDSPDRFLDDVFSPQILALLSESFILFLTRGQKSNIDLNKT